MVPPMFAFTRFYLIVSLFCFPSGSFPLSLYNKSEYENLSDTLIFCTCNNFVLCCLHKRYKQCTEPRHTHNKILIVLWV